MDKAGSSVPTLTIDIRDRAHSSIPVASELKTACANDEPLSFKPKFEAVKTAHHSLALQQSWRLL